MKKKGVVCAGWNKRLNRWELWKTKEDALKGRKDREHDVKDYIDTVCGLSKYLNRRPLNKKKIYVITSREA